MGRHEPACRTTMIMLFQMRLCIILFVLDIVNTNKYDEEHAARWLDAYNEDACEQDKRMNEVAWMYETNITPGTEEEKLKEELRQQKWNKEVTNNASRYDWKSFDDFDVRRQLKFLSIKGSTVLTDQEIKDYLQLQQDMQSKYSTAKICDYNNRNKCDLRLEPEMTRIIGTSRDYDELKWVWEQWREESGKQMRHEYVRYIDYVNKIADKNGFEDGSDYWTMPYEADDFEDQVEELWEELRPFYLQLHAYVRRALQEKYGKAKVSSDGPVPAHLFGNMWAQSWSKISDLLRPYPGKKSVDVTPQMKNQGYDAKKMFQMADEFFQSLGFPAMPRKFWDNTVLERIPGRDMVCHASAWDFCEKNNVRIKMCTDITMDDFITVHHEMGHIMYFMEYGNQKYSYKSGANPGFHEAIGDVIALSVATPKHLNKVGLLDKLEYDMENDINFLMNMALDKIAFLPFGYLVDSYRWKILKGDITERNLNCKWWELREKYQGIKSPVPRNEGDFDPGAKYHVAASVKYIRYFVAMILQFDFHRSLCKEAGEYDPDDPDKPLYRCDIYQNKDAGKLLGDVLKMGSSRPWPDALEKITGERKMSAMAIREYFKPLEEWLKKKNKENGATIGWKKDGSYCTSDGYVPVIDSSSSHLSFSLLTVIVSLLLTFRLYKLW